MINVSIQPEADREFRKAIRWYRRKSVHTSHRFFEAVLDVVIKLEDRDLPEMKYRTSIYWIKVKKFPYIIYYMRMNANNRLIVAVAHKERKPGYWIRRIVQ